MENASVVIIGGGLLGASVAYQLAKQGEQDIILLERFDLASAASCQAAGLMFQISSKPAIDELSRTTFKTIKTLEEQLGEGLDFKQVGTLRLAETEKNRTALNAIFSRAECEGIRAEIVDAKRRTDLVPWLVTGPDTLSVFFADEGYIDPYLLTTAYARAAKQLGVQVKTKVAVHAICIDKGRVAGLETSLGKISCKKVVVAAGSWSNSLTVPLGIPLPMIPTRSHFWITGPDPLFSNGQPMTVHADAGAFTRPEVGGILIGIQEKHSPTFDYRILPDDVNSFAVTENGSEWDELIEAQDRIAGFFPLEDAQFKSYIAGLSAYTPDCHFILDHVAKRPGLYLAAGCCGSGVMASGGIGEALADLILENSSSYDLAPFRYDRFGDVDPSSTEFQNRCAEARAGKAV